MYYFSVTLDSNPLTNRQISTFLARNYAAAYDLGGGEYWFVGDLDAVRLFQKKFFPNSPEIRPVELAENLVG